ncbi:MAG: type II toxin-antitoxin system prevent-host-death family antitoxin [Tepidisphaeraceae bacterium]
MAAIQHPNIVGAYDAKTRFSELLELVEGGKEFTITKHGTPVARLVPARKKMPPQQRREAIGRWIESSKGVRLGGLKIRDLVNEGRP